MNTFDPAVTFDALSNIGLLYSDEDDRELFRHIAEAQRFIIRAIERAKERNKEIDGNAELSEQGRISAHKKVDVKLNEELLNIKRATCYKLPSNRHSLLEQELAVAVAKMRAIPENAVRELRDQRILKVLQDQDPIEHESLMTEIIESQDAEVIGAIMRAPSFDKFYAGPEEEEHFRIAWLKATKPEIFEEFEELDEAMGFLDRAITQNQKVTNPQIAVTRPEKNLKDERLRKRMKASNVT